MAEKRRSSRPPEPPSAAVPKQRGVSLADLAEQFDFPTKVAAAIRKALKRLPAGRVYSDTDMRFECGIGPSARIRLAEWREIAEREEFLAYQFQINGKGVFWAQPKTVSSACAQVGKAQNLREMFEGDS